MAQGVPGPPDPPPEEGATAAVDAALLIAIERSHDALRSAFEQGLFELAREISLSQLRLMELLEQVGESRLTDLAAALDVAASTATRLCDGLAARDLIVRRRRDQDRRVLRIQLTGAGRALLQAVHEAGSSAQRRALHTIGNEERADLAALLSKVADAAEEELRSPGTETSEATWR